MDQLQGIPGYQAEPAGGVVVVAAEAGQSRRAALQQWLAEAQQSGARTWLLSCDCAQGGIWAGVADLLLDLVPRIRERAPHLLEKHSYELCLAVPSLRRSMTVRNPNLTESVSAEEKVRNYPVDRAYRSLHGLIDLLDAWHQIDDAPWAIACDNYDRTTGFIHRFFGELMRRRGRQLRLTLLVAVAPDMTETALQRFPSIVTTQAVRLNLSDAEDATVSPALMRHEARVLEQQVEADAIARETYLPRLIHYWQQSDTPEKALRWQVEAMHLYIHRGLYEAANMYSAEVEDNLERLYGEDRDLYDLGVSSLFFCYVPLGQPERAHTLLQEKLLDRAVNPRQRARTYYLMAMLYARFLKANDLALAEEYLNESIDLLSDADLPQDEREFSIVFSMNGLAFVRLRQRRPEDAVALCRTGIERLNAHLRPDQHRLHRSVLLYNVAQVYAIIGPYEDALAYFSAAMEMDPHYSEYYNERGTVYFKLERFDEAERDYLTAITLSPPYAEVWTNLGQCYRAMERMEDAAAAYSTALDLDPETALALAGRADAYAALGQSTAALADFDAALALDPAQPALRAARAVVAYEAGRIHEALDDLNTAIALAPQMPELYQNRAVALADLGRIGEAGDDLATYLRLAPAAEDRQDVVAQLAAWQVERGVAAGAR